MDYPVHVVVEQKNKQITQLKVLLQKAINRALSLSTNPNCIYFRHWEEDNKHFLIVSSKVSAKENWRLAIDRNFAVFRGQITSMGKKVVNEMGTHYDVVTDVEIDRDSVVEFYFQQEAVKKFTEVLFD